MKPVIFPLARFGRFFQNQSADVVIFYEESLVLKSGDELIQEISYPEIHKIEFIFPSDNVPGFVRTMIGTGWMRGEPKINIQIGEEHLQLTLEMNVYYGKGEMVRLLEFLYREQVPLTERFSMGGESFLMEVMTQNEIEEGKMRLLESNSQS